MRSIKKTQKIKRPELKELDTSRVIQKRALKDLQGGSSTKINETKVGTTRYDL
ncbi:MAG: hypothetical protein KC777_12445 [Cyanobacteria bacterium HKST-UBA02]|nr:hypothetical protein [Cyanobacteria bacterium HKST-UBA02]